MDFKSLERQGYAVYPRSVRPIEGGRIFVARRGASKLIGLARTGDSLALGSRVFDPTVLPSGEVESLHEFTWENYQALRRLIPLGPVRCNRDASFGMGDRLGMATPAHLDSLITFPVFPVIAQQSPRELAKTGRTFQSVLLDAVMGALEVGFQGAWGADADHIKDESRLLEAVRAGYSMYTMDLSGWVPSLPPSDSSGLPDYSNLSDLSRGIIQKASGLKIAGREMSEPELLRSAAIYQVALEKAVGFYDIIRAEMPGFDFEVSIDEGSKETTLEDHFFAAEHLHASGVEFTSLAPRFPGKFRKGVDFEGDLDLLAASMEMHARLAREIAGYKLSLHSGSDKWSVYYDYRNATRGHFHVKTSGTSWLEAMTFISQTDKPLFREMYRIALDNLNESVKYYDTEISLKDFPRELPRDTYISRADTNLRQLWHISYGILLAEKGDAIRRALAEHESEHYEWVRRHMGQHLQFLM